MTARPTTADIHPAAARVRAGSRPQPLRSRRNWIIAAVLLLAALGAGYLLLSGRNKEASGTAVAAPALTVTTTTPQRVTWSDTVTASGVIAPWQEASVGTQIGSYQLVEIRANVGDQVRRGQVLARLNTALLRAEEAQLLARHDQAQLNSRRAQDLQASGAISDQEVLQFRTEAKTAAALLAAKRLELRYTSVVAPDDGVITARAATLGAVVPAGAELFRMIRQNRLEWRGELSAAQLPSVAVGEPITLKLPGGGQATATVRQTGPAMEAQTRLALVYADLAPGSAARAGMYVTGEITVGRSAALTVPAQSVVVRDGRSHVMQIDRTLTVRRRVVTTGRRSGDAIEIVRGLSGAERLVLKGAGFLNDGDVVRVAPPQGQRR